MGGLIGGDGGEGGKGPGVMTTAALLLSTQGLHQAGSVRQDQHVLEWMWQSQKVLQAL